MAGFSYVAITKQGKQKKGTIQAEDRSRALEAIKAMDLIPTSVTEQGFLQKDINISMGSKITVREKALFCRQFASLLRAGVTIVDALSMLADSTENKGLAKAVRAIAANIQKGETMGISMREFPEYFDNMMISLVDAGEASGSIDNSLDRMAQQYEKDSKVQAAVKKAMVYPIIVIIVAVAVVIVMLTWIVPTFMKMFEGINLEMPKITLAVVAASNFMKSNVALVILGLVLLVVLFKVYQRTPQGQSFLGYLGIRLPAIGPFTTKSATSRMSRTLSTLTGSGIPLVEALQITSHTMSNVHFKNAILEAREQVLKGVPLSEPLQRSKLFPPMVVHMVRIGEETGDLDNMLVKLAGYYEEEVELATQQLLAAMEPMIMLLLAGTVGVIIAAVMAPMVKLYTGLDESLMAFLRILL